MCSITAVSIGMQLSSVYSGCMIGNHGYEVILDAYVKGLRNFDVASAYAAMREEVRREGEEGGEEGGGEGREDKERKRQCTSDDLLFPRPLIPTSLMTVGHVWRNM